MNIRRMSAAALLMSFFALSALALGMGTAQAQDSTPASDQSFPVNIRFMNAMTSLDKVDVYINGDESDQRVVEGLEYGTVSEAANDCDPYESGVSQIKRRFSQSHTYKRAGAFRIVFRLKHRDRVLTSQTTIVRLLGGGF